MEESLSIRDNGSPQIPYVYWHTLGTEWARAQDARAMVVVRRGVGAQ
jgi:hypothetical protein